MDTLLKKVVHCTILSLLCTGALTAPALGQNAEIYIVEAGTNAESAGGGPTIVDITGRRGQQISFEVFVRHIGPDPLTPIRGVAVDLPCVAEGGLSGSVEYVPDSGEINQFRPDFLFLGAAIVAAVDSTCQDGTVRSIAQNVARRTPSRYDGRLRFDKWETPMEKP